MSSKIRIGTRDSELATWQAKQVQSKLKEFGFEAELFFVKSEGDLDLTTPLTEMGGKGVFTKALDDALLENRIDIAVHSFKDLPTENPLPLTVSAVMEREDPRDALVAPKGVDFLEDESSKAIIATSSNRRKAQWLHRYPNHEITNIRGNVNTRLRKVNENGWNGAIFAAAGLKRIGLDNNISVYLDWMVPAPAQGAMAVMIREEDQKMLEITSQLNHKETAICTGIERELLNEMEAGCSAPVGAFAEIVDGDVHLSAIALKIDGSLQYDIEVSAPVHTAKGLGREAGRKLLDMGASEIVADLRS
ncbi:hydroxymethylbilane synthase [Rhodohalobacter barkolensis]|uniref:Porphobilinogen deaminase n=1 Tax=Rhodohalobacter barkolensis TaxID=2053187 RepID=A0A2N0VHI5_9BACT|nr:hydroxymethylbilane synthase [Rhodohalobacter barkolensis]PKD43651.1 hydroxymethylbilane synthase [Rhodohalobacter barkolensis]